MQLKQRAQKTNNQKKPHYDITTSETDQIHVTVHFCKKSACFLRLNGALTFFQSSPVEEDKCWDALHDTVRTAVPISTK